MVLEIKEKFIDSIPFKNYIGDEDTRKYFFSKTANTLFISMKINVEDSGLINTYNALYKYTTEKGYQFIRLIEYGNMIEIIDNNDVPWLYISNLKYKIPLNDISATPIYNSELVDTLEYYDVDNFDNMILYQDDIHIFYDTKHFMINKSLKSNTVIWEDLPVTNGYRRTAITNKLGLCIYDNKIRISGLCSFDGSVTYVTEDFQWDKINKFTKLNTNIDSSIIPFDDLNTVNFNNTLYLFNTSNVIRYYDGNNISIQEKNDKKLELLNIPEFVWIMNNEIHFITYNDLYHYSIMRFVEQGKCNCYFPVKIKNNVISVSDGSTISSDVVFKKSDDNILEWSEKLYYGNNPIKNFNVNLNSMYSLGRCFHDRYLVFLLGTTYNDTGLYTYDILKDEFKKANIREDYKITCDHPAQVDLFIKDLDKLYLMGHYGQANNSLIINNFGTLYNLDGHVFSPTYLATDTPVTNINIFDVYDYGLKKMCMIGSMILNYTYFSYFIFNETTMTQYSTFSSGYTSSGSGKFLTDGEYIYELFFIKSEDYMYIHKYRLRNRNLEEAGYYAGRLSENIPDVINDFDYIEAFCYGGRLFIKYDYAGYVCLQYIDTDTINPDTRFSDIIYLQSAIRTGGIVIPGNNNVYYLNRDGKLYSLIERIDKYKID